MIVVAVVAILGAIALPSYQEYVRRGHRTEARAALLQTALWMERAAAATGDYPATLPSALTSVASGGYTLAAAPNQGSGNFTLLATPKTGGPMANDRCGVFSFNQASERGVDTGTGIQTTGDLVTDCWKR